jgi:hypothetical protein
MARFSVSTSALNELRRLLSKVPSERQKLSDQYGIGEHTTDERREYTRSREPVRELFAELEQSRKAA